jgi:hypothetical protein
LTPFLAIREALAFFKRPSGAEQGLPEVAANLEARGYWPWRCHVEIFSSQNSSKPPYCA